MAKIKNITIAAIVAVIVSQIALEGTTPEQKTNLQGVVDSLTALDATLATDQAGVEAATRDLQSKFNQLTIDKEASDLLVTSVQEKLTAANNQWIERSNGNADLKAIYEKQLEEAQEVIVDLQDQLKIALEVKANASAFPVGEFESVKYEVLSGAHGHGSAKEIAADPAKIGAILKIKGQTIIKPLNA